MNKSILNLSMMALSIGLLTQCDSSSVVPSATSIQVQMSAATTNGSTLINGRTMLTDREAASTAVTLTDVMVNVRSIGFEFDKDDPHFRDNKYRKDSCYSEDHEAKLKGPFLVDLMNAGSFENQLLTSVNIPNAKYERVRFKLSPSSASGDMQGKSIMIKGKIDTTHFVFWHDRDANFGAKFADSTALATSGGAADVAIHLELDKILSALNGGADLSKATDGNKDGVITIDPRNDDGNKWLADQIMMLLIRHAHCERKNR